jgi:hypothetical protein
MANPTGRNWDETVRNRMRSRLADLIGRLPEVRAEDANGHTGYYLRERRIAWLLVDHHGDGRLALWAKAPAGDQSALIRADPVRYFVPPYLGKSGWVAADLGAAEPDWSRISVILEQAWRSSASKRAVAEFDALRAERATSRVGGAMSPRISAGHQARRR